ncbi:hypothetical protein [Streptomyces sp. NPDC048481]|uniref:DUF7144 family membrane protein n=1 Tax=Streptomyces sp. NPDC048481 TaxID=3365557 RepID=UPI0037145B75
MSDQPHAQPSHGSPVWDPSHQGTGTPPDRPAERGAGAGLAAGGVVFAGVIMFVSGVLAAFQGIAAIARDDVYARIGTYVYELNLTGWGWVLLAVGVVAAVTGWGLLTGAVWARVSGIALASLSLVLQFLFLPYAPFWAVIQIALDVFVIWALASHDPAASPTT